MKTEANKILRRQICPVVKVLDGQKGIVEYVASDESIDNDREIVRAKGWRFDYMQKNAPFVDSHDYSTIEKLIGRVLDFSVDDSRLVETAQWAVDVPENRLAQIGWKMTLGGFLKAVSVGFTPVKAVTRDSDAKEFRRQLGELGLNQQEKVRTIWLEQQQRELSAVIMGSNSNALAKAYKAEVIKEDDLEYLSGRIAASTAAKEFPEGTDLEPVRSTERSALVEWAEARTRKAFWEQFERSLKKVEALGKETDKTQTPL